MPDRPWSKTAGAPAHCAFPAALAALQDIHSYSTCPYLHLNEQSAQRRDPLLYKYDSIFCYDLHNTKACKRGPNCPYSHNLFEYFLHPSRCVA